MESIIETFQGKPVIVFFNKTDVANQEQLERAERLFGQSLKISASRGEGLDAMMESIKRGLEASSRHPRLAP